MRKIRFNSQRNNFDFAGKFKGYQQCFATSAWMFMSFFSDFFRADDDKQLAKYVDDVCNEVGESGIGEEEAKYHKLSGNSAYYWLVQSAGIKKWLGSAGKKIAISYDSQSTADKIKSALKDSPVIVGTNRLGGLKGGHIILIADIDGEDFIVNDPYGNARTNYTDHNGDSVRYPVAWLSKYLTGHTIYGKEIIV